MSKWTAYQLLGAAGLLALLTFINLCREQVSTLFTFVDSFIPSSILVIFFTIILVIWGLATLLFLQEKKGKPLFVHKIWRIMPGIMSVVLFLSIVIFIALGMTVLADLNDAMKWIIDVLVIYFMSVFYMLILSIVIRYGKNDTSKGKILTSANVSVLILIFVLLFIPPIV
ncbi:hypothetical protein MHZ95_12420 [Sporosarcina sp. ACRSM]|uniref:hypothetical protein n=1 Tax=Sporosarcina sp. ACRSM TaxID=2918216 RepID=UPI001EF66D04|nr:hypothetical protein [Sporosarcina sp. ACRSM]MCG7336068.1 hypothetical protein [Sporosarcina sp. ACRSM]